MRGLLVGSIGLAILLAGCAGSDEPAHRSSTTGSDEAPRPPPSFLRPMTWTTLSAGAFTVGPVDAWGVDITIPPRTEAVLVNLTGLMGPTLNLRGAIAECPWEFGGAFVARGQSTGFGCPLPLDGADRVTLAHDAGRLEGTFEIVAYHERTRGR